MVTAKERKKANQKTPIRNRIALLPILSQEYPPLKVLFLTIPVSFQKAGSSGYKMGCFSELNTQENHPEIVLKCRLWSNRPGWGLSLWISSKLLTAAGGPETTL